MNTPQSSPDLASLRVQIDNIDQQLLTLLNQRALVAERVGEVKKREGTPFFLRDESLNEAFLAGAKEAGLLQLKGHKSVGGMRASLYNAMPMAGVQALVDYMKHFATTHG